MGYNMTIRGVLLAILMVNVFMDPINCIILNPSQNNDLKLVFAYEINRHGARTPFNNNPKHIKGFKTNKGMLTPQGMRQKYFEGKYIRQKYIKEKHLLSEQMVPGELYI